MWDERRRSERLRLEGSKALLVTKRGYVGGIMVDVSDTGALVAADARDLIGTRVLLRVQQPDKVWERAGMVVWFESARGTAIEFESSRSTTPRSIS